jgi:hypothetical protein
MIKFKNAPKLKRKNTPNALVNNKSREFTILAHSCRGNKNRAEKVNKRGNFACYFFFSSESLIVRAHVFLYGYYIMGKITPYPQVYKKIAEIPYYNNI